MGVKIFYTRLFEFSFLAFFAITLILLGPILVILKFLILKPLIYIIASFFVPASLLLVRSIELFSMIFFLISCFFMGASLLFVKYITVIFGVFFKIALVTFTILLQSLVEILIWFIQMSSKGIYNFACLCVQ